MQHINTFCEAKSIKNQQSFNHFNQKSKIKNHRFLLLLLFLFIGCKNDADNTVTKNKSDVSTIQKCTFKAADTPSLRKIRFDQFEDLLDINNDILYIYTFFSIDCQPCIAQMACYEQVYQELKTDNKVQLVYVNLDSSKDMQSKVLPFVRKKGLSGQVLSLDIARREMIYNFIDEDWRGQLPATLFVDNSAETWMFYEKAFNDDELKAVVQPLLTFKNLM